MTLHDMFKQSNMNPDFCQKNCALNQDAYLSGDYCISSMHVQLSLVKDLIMFLTWLTVLALM